MTEKTDFEKGRGGAMIFGALVYVGVVLAATTLFISFILTAFPADAYFSRFVMVVAGLLVGGSMLAFPVALHKWAVSGTHRMVTTGLYYGEMAIVALNTLVSFASMLAKYSGYTMPEWISLYEPFTIVSIVYTLAAWGTVFQLDPIAKATARDMKAEQDFREKVSKKKIEFLDSIEGENAVMAVAELDIAAQFSADRFRKDAKHFGSGKTTAQPLTTEASAPRMAPPIEAKPSYRPASATPDPSPFLGHAMTTYCMECGKEAESLFCSQACELSHTERNARIQTNRLNQLKARGAEVDLQPVPLVGFGHNGNGHK